FEPDARARAGCIRLARSDQPAGHGGGTQLDVPPAMALGHAGRDPRSARDKGSPARMVGKVRTTLNAEPAERAENCLLCELCALCVDRRVYCPAVPRPPRPAGCGLGSGLRGSFSSRIAV